MTNGVIFKVIDKSQYTPIDLPSAKIATAMVSRSGEIDKLISVDYASFKHKLGIPSSLSSFYLYSALEKFPNVSALVKRLTLLSDDVDLENSNTNSPEYKLKQYLIDQGYSIDSDGKLIDSNALIREDRRLYAFIDNGMNRKLKYYKGQVSTSTSTPTTLSTNLLSGLKIPYTDTDITTEIEITEKLPHWRFKESHESNWYNKITYIYDSTNNELVLYLYITSAGDKIKITSDSNGVYMTLSPTDSTITEMDVCLWFIESSIECNEDTEKLVIDSFFENIYDSRSTFFTPFELYTAYSKDSVIPFVLKFNTLGKVTDDYKIEFIPQTYIVKEDGNKYIDMVSLKLYINGVETEVYTDLSLDAEHDRFLAKVLPSLSQYITNVVIGYVEFDTTLNQYVYMETEDYTSPSSPYKNVKWILPQHTPSSEDIPFEGFYTQADIPFSSTPGVIYEEDLVYYNTLNIGTTGTYSYIKDIYADVVYLYQLRSNKIQIDNPDDIFQGYAEEEFYSIGTLTLNDIEHLLYIDLKSSATYKLFTRPAVSFDILIFPFKNTGNIISSYTKSIIEKRQYRSWGYVELFAQSVADAKNLSNAIESTWVISPGAYANGIVYNADVGKYYTLPGGHQLLLAVLNTDQVAYPWYSPAGLNRGQITAFKELTEELDDDDLDNLASDGAKVNPVYTRGNNQIVLWDAITFYREYSALQEIQVVRMLAWLFNNLYQVLPIVIHENNTSALEAKIKSLIKPFTNKIYETGGLLEAPQIEISASPIDLDNNIRRVTIILNPAKALKKLIVSAIITNSSVEFNVNQQ